MAFFDDDPPTQQRRSSGPPNPPRPKTAQDQQTIWARRGVAGVIFLLVLLVVGLGLNGCVDSSRKNALQDYGQAVGEIGTESSSNVSQGLQILARPGDQEALAQRNSLDKLASDSRSLTERARDLSTPGGLEGATQNLVTALSLRADALARIADRIATARGTSRTQAEDATKHIAGQMEALLASDVLWQLRVTPYIKDRAAELEVRDDGVEDSVVMNNLGWLNAATVANRIDGQTDTEDTNTQTQCVANSPHGHGLTGVSANGKNLVEGSTAVTTIPSGSGLSFVVSIANQGENDETGVLVSISGTSKATGKEVFSETKKVAKTTKGQPSQVSIPISAAVSSAVTVTAEVKPVACEINKTNNKKTFQVIFG